MTQPLSPPPPLPYLAPSLSLTQTNLEITGETDFSKLLHQEEEYVEKLCNEIIALKPDLVITEKGLSGGWSLCNYNLGYKVP